MHVTSVKAALVDWPRTDKYSASARYQRYAETRGEEDFRILSNEVALALNDIALSANRQQALALAEKVRSTVADWPRMHFGYRQSDVREIISVLDQAISTLRAASGATSFELSLVAMADSPELEPVAVHAQRAPAARRDLSRGIPEQGVRKRRAAAVGVVGAR